MAKNPPKEIAPTATDKKSKAPKLEFPRHKLLDALRVAEALEAKNGGLPLPPTDMAIAMGMSPGSSSFRDLLSSSIKYGLTNGSFNSERISLTSLGEEIVRPRNEDERANAMLTAALKPPTFSATFAYYKGKKIPDPVFFKNTLAREMAVPLEFGDLCAQVFVSNAEKVGLIRTASTGKWLSSDASISVRPESTETPNDATERVEELPSDEEVALPSDIKEVPQQPNKAIFIGHGRNTKPLEQLTKILNHLNIPYKVAMEEANAGRPISIKVAETLRSCGAAILIFSADEEFMDTEGNTLWRPRENVIHELGAASVLYGNRIVIFKEATVNLASNFRDIGYISFEKDQLEAKMMDLLKELIAFGLVKLTVAPG